MLVPPHVEGALNSVLGMSSRFLRTAEHPAVENLPRPRGMIRSSHKKHKKREMKLIFGNDKNCLKLEKVHRIFMINSHGNLLKEISECKETVRMSVYIIPIVSSFTHTGTKESLETNLFSSILRKLFV